MQVCECMNDSSHVFKGRHLDDVMVCLVLFVEDLSYLSLTMRGRIVTFRITGT